MAGAITRFRPSFPYFFSEYTSPATEPGRRDRAIAYDAGIRNHISLRVLVHRLRRGQRRLLAVVDESGFAVVRAQQQKSAAAKIACDRMHDCKREAGRHRCIDSIAPLAQDLYSRIGGKMMNADHHAVLRPNRLFAAVREHACRALLRDRRGGRQYGEVSRRCKQDESGETRVALHSFRQDNPAGNEGIALLSGRMKKSTLLRVAIARAMSPKEVI